MALAQATHAIARSVERVHARTQKKAARRVAVAAVSQPEGAVEAGDDKKARRPRFPRKNVTVQDDQVVVGASFTGKVKRIQDYGCFVDFGAKTDGLVHISELATGFVDKVSAIVAEDQEVKVWIKEIKDNKISLTMKQPPTEAELAAQKSEQEAKFAARQAYKKAQDVKSQAVKSLKKGQKIEGEVKSIQPFGAFIEVAEGVEGLVHVTELSDDFNVNVADFCKVGEKVTVTIIGIEGAKVKLSMKDKLDLSGMNAEAQSVVDSSASALEFAFKKKGISADMFPKGSKAAAAPAPAAKASEKVAPAAAPAAAAAAAPVAAPAAAEKPKAAPAAAAADAAGGVSAALVKQLRESTGAGMMDCKKALAQCNGNIEEATVFLRKKGMASADKKASRIAAEGAVASYIHAGSRIGVIVEINCETDFVARGDRFKALAADIAMQVAACPNVEYVNPSDADQAMVERERAIEMQKEDLMSKPEAIRAKIVQGRLDKLVNEKALITQAYIRDSTKTVEVLVKEATAELGEKISIRRFERYNLGEGIEKRVNDFAAEVAAQTQAKAPAPAAPKVEKKVEAAAPAKDAVKVDAAVVKQLRDSTGAGMMDCKKALAECNNNLEEATAFLRKKGMASADKKASRIAAEGAVASYIHAGSRIGVLVEINCETDFVARGDRFKALAADIAMQVAACPDIEYVNPSDADQAMVERERAIEMQKEDLMSKPEAIRAKIVQGRLDKLVNEKALITQAYIRDSTKTVEVLVKEATAELGEKISIRRFRRFNLGEGIEKKVSDFAAEVAAATGKA